MASLEALQSTSGSREERHQEWSQRREQMLRADAGEVPPAQATAATAMVTRPQAASASMGMPASAAAATSGVATAGTVVVVGAAQRREDLEAKKLFRPAAKITALMPFGGAGLELKVPKRKDYGKEGEEGDAAHAAAMKQFSVKEFGNSHVEQRVIDARMGRVGQFGFWLELNHYGKYVEWQVTQGPRGKARCMVAVERDDTPRVVADVAVMECMQSTDRMAGSADWLASRVRAHLLMHAWIESR